MNQKERTLHLTFVGPIDDSTATTFMANLDNAVTQQKIEHLYMHINSPGGSVNAGIMLYNFLRSLPVMLSTHNIGRVDSIGNVVFLAGEHRFASPATSFLMHGVTIITGQQTTFTRSALEEHLSQIKQDERRISTIVKDRTKLSLTMLTKFMRVGRSLGPDEALTHGIIHGIQSVTHTPDSVRHIVSTYPQNK